MILHATKVLGAVIGAGFVPKQITAVGPFDEGTSIGSAGPTLAKVAKPGANRVLACEFEPLGDRTPIAAAQASVAEVVTQLHAKLAHLEEIEFGAVSTCFADLRFFNAEATPLSLQMAVFALDGMVYRFALSAIESKSDEMRAGLNALVLAVIPQSA